MERIGNEADLTPAESAWKAALVLSVAQLTVLSLGWSDLRMPALRALLGSATLAIAASALLLALTVEAHDALREQAERRRHGRRMRHALALFQYGLLADVALAGCKLCLAGG